MLKPFSIQGLLYTLSGFKISDPWCTLQTIPQHMQNLFNIETFWRAIWGKASLSLILLMHKRKMVALLCGNESWQFGVECEKKEMLVLLFQIYGVGSTASN